MKIFLRCTSQKGHRHYHSSHKCHMLSFRCQQLEGEIYKFDDDCCAGSDVSVSPARCANGFTRTETTSCGHGHAWCDANGCKEYTCKKSTSCVEYVGCYEDRTGAPDLPFLVTDFNSVLVPSADGYRMSSQVSECSNRCRKRNFTFAALQGAETCRCGDTYGKYGVADGRLCEKDENKGVALRCGDGKEGTCVGINAVYRLTGQLAVGGPLNIR